MKTFLKQKQQISSLNKQNEAYLEREFCGKDYLKIISNPDSFVDGVYYHQANSAEERKGILESGFNKNKVSNSNCGAGRGLYLGRDRNALINFYADDVNYPQDFIVKIIGKFNFLDLLDNQTFLQKNKNNLEEKVLGLGYDGIRYYDPDATGEEFVLFNHSKILIEK